MQNAESHPASAPESNHNVWSGRVQLGAKLTDRLKSLEEWRISPSLLEFPEGGPESGGGFATVSWALLGSSYGRKEGIHEAANGEDAVEGSNGRNSKINDSVWNSEDNREIQQGERVNEKTSPNDEGAAEGRSRESNDKALPGRKLSNSDSGIKPVAVKRMIISDDLTRVLGLTLREAEYLIELKHENIICLEGFVEDVSKNIIWLVFPWADNGTLKDFIASADWEIPERISLIDDVANGVEYLHSREPPICHGDLKSTNILVNSKYRAVITDFGSARRLIVNDLKVTGERAETTLQTAQSLEPTFCASTNTITLTGDQYTLRWAAPELLTDEDSGTPRDIWAFGWVAYEVMTNFIPFHDALTKAVVIMRVVKGDLPSLSNDARMLLIQALCAVMIECWVINPSKRPTAENCRKSIEWMPMIIPNPVRTEDRDGSRIRSPGLLMRLGEMYAGQDDYLKASKYFTEALGTYRDVDDNGGEANALFALARIHRLQDEYNQAIPLYTKALEIYTKICDRPGRALVLWNLAEVHRARNEYNCAVPLYSESLQISTEICNREGRAEALTGLADVHRVQREYIQAVTLYSEALQIHTEIGNRQGKADALSSLGDMHRLQEEYSQAVASYTEALQIRAEIGDRRGKAGTLWGLAEVHQLREEYSQAISLFSESLEICTEIGDREGKADALSSLGDVHRLQDEYSQAVAFYTEALRIRAEIGDREGKAGTLWGLAEVHRLRDEYSQAISFFAASLEICTEIDDRQGKADALSSLAEVHRLQGEYNQSFTLYSEALQIQSEIGDKQGKANTLWNLAEAHRLREEHSQAFAFFSESLKICIDIGDRHREALALEGLADVHCEQDHYCAAIHHYEQAAEVYKHIGRTDDAADALEAADNVRQLLEENAVLQAFASSSSEGRPAEGLGAPTSAPETGGSLFRASKPVDVDQNQRMMRKRSFGQVARSPEAVNTSNPFERRNAGDMSLSELQPKSSVTAGEGGGDEDSSNDDELALNASRRSQRFAGRVAQDSRMEEPRRDVQADRGLGAGESQGAVGHGSSTLPGSFHTGEEEDEDAESTQPARKKRGGKSKIESTKEQKSARSGSRKAPTPSAPATATTTTNKKSTTNRTSRTTASKSTVSARASTPPTAEEPRTVRRSSRLSATPSVTGGRTASPDRKKARSSAEPEPATLTASTRKSGRAATTSTRKTTSGRSASGRTTRGQVQSIVEEE